ncbi:MAG: hypothetical protein A3E87_02815 [Gammaproteobacteria bacterium RIFCSPHIGHO2_12_FULL_35_23]|nr:MAG: hypothetical protein A3E87_02815 [Gammaproteobacteria bacterium RIFCSPHIGHO2_12_FULL_35_23]
MLKFNFQKLFFMLVGLFLTSCCFAKAYPDLLLVLKAASLNDPTYQNQVAKFNAILQQIPENRAPLLPQLDLSSTIDREISDTARNGNTYTTPANSGLNVTQTIFNLNLFRLLARAKDTVQAAVVTLSAEQQNLMIRTATAYYGVLQAEDILSYTEQQQAFIRRQLTATKTRYEHRDATITDLQQAQGADDLISAELVTAKLNLYNAYQRLSEITSKIYPGLASLKNTFPLISPQPTNLSVWLKLFDTDNLTLRAARLDIVTANENIKVNQANYLPTLSANVDYNNGQTQTTSSRSRTITQADENASVGLNLNWQAYQGGLTTAQIDQAVAEQEQTEANMRKAYLSAASETRQAYTGVLLGINRINSDRSAVTMNTNALNNADEGYRAGVVTITEVLQIQYQLFNSQKQYAQDLYAYLLDILRLKQAAGTLSVTSIAEENQWLE